MKTVLTVTKTRIFPVETERIVYQRRKQKAKRADVLKTFAGEEAHHELTGDELLCPDCQQEMEEIGTYPVRQELLFIPAQIKRLGHIQHAYKCEAYSLKNPADKIIKALVPIKQRWNIVTVRLQLLLIPFTKNTS